MPPNVTPKKTPGHAGRLYFYVGSDLFTISGSSFSLTRAVFSLSVAPTRTARSGQVVAFWDEISQSSVVASEKHAG
jgi:hypothetical protein